MLKIKDNVDLKELEKFGFISHTYSNATHYEIELLRHSKWIRVNGITRKIIINNDSVNNDIPNILYDLIKADLVEKVE